MSTQFGMRSGGSSECGGGGAAGPPGSDPSATVGTSSTVTPSAVEASAAVPRLEESEVCTASAVVEAGTAMVAVMSTLPAATLIVTSDLSTPAAVATFCCKLDLSLSEKSLTLPLAVSVSTTDAVEGGGDGGGDGGESGTWRQLVSRDLSSHRSTQVGVATLKVNPVPGDGVGVALDGALLRGMRCPTRGPQANREELLGQVVGTLGGTAGEFLEVAAHKVQAGLRRRNQKLLLRLLGCGGIWGGAGGSDGNGGARANMSDRTGGVAASPTNGRSGGGAPN
eukprot:scaffold85992_cov63-Phaeocystis_antarctica.AAC.10